jgi:hypothetical protein
VVVAQLVDQVGLDKLALAMYLQIARFVDGQQPGIFVHHLVIQVDLWQGWFGQFAGDHVPLADNLVRGGGTAVAGHLTRFNARLPGIARLVGKAAR